MGHLEPGGEASGQDAAAPLTRRRNLFKYQTFWREGDAPHPVWTLWWALKREFTLWSTPVDWLSTPGSWTYFGNDFVSGLRRNPSTARAFALMDAEPARFEAVRALAALNVRRHEQMFHFVALLYVTIPVTVILGLAEVSPEGVIAHFQKNSGLALYMVGILTVGAGVYLIGLWRARQLVSVLDLWRLERPDA